MKGTEPNKGGSGKAGLHCEGGPCELQLCGGVQTHLGAFGTPPNHMSPGGDPPASPWARGQPLVRTEIWETWVGGPSPGAALPAPALAAGSRGGPLSLEVTSAKVRGSGPTVGVRPPAGARPAGRGLCREHRLAGPARGCGGRPGPCLAPPPALLCRQSSDSGSGVAAVSAWTGGGGGPRWEERGGGRARGTRPGPGQPGAGTALPPQRSPALPRPGGLLLCTHLRAVCPAQLGPSLGSSGPFPLDAHLASGLCPGFSGGLWTPWPGLLLLPLVSSVLCVCPTP